MQTHRFIPASESSMNRLSIRVVLPAAFGIAYLACFPARGQTAPHAAEASPQSSAASKPQEDQNVANVSALPRGKQLILKNGSSEIVREYSIEADRVRYYSVERSQWEEIPSALVDWDATHRAEAAQAQSQAQQLAAVEKRERERRAEAVDVGASYEVAPGIFLPEGDGLYILQDKTLSAMTPASTDLKTDKRRAAEQAVVPLPVIPARRHLQLKGSRAALRVHAQQPEFYLRASESQQPQVELLRLRVHGDTRVIEDLESLMNQSNTVKQTISLETWKSAEGLCRFTLSRPLAPGEYALTELPAGKQDADILVFDFGVDPAPNSGH